MPLRLSKRRSPETSCCHLTPEKNGARSPSVGTTGALQPAGFCGQMLFFFLATLHAYPTTPHWRKQKSLRAALQPPRTRPPGRHRRPLEQSAQRCPSAVPGSLAVLEAQKALLDGGGRWGEVGGGHARPLTLCVCVKRSPFATSPQKLKLDGAAAHHMMSSQVPDRYASSTCITEVYVEQPSACHIYIYIFNSRRREFASSVVGSCRNDLYRL